MIGFIVGMVASVVLYLLLDNFTDINPWFAAILALITVGNAAASFPGWPFGRKRGKK